VDVWFERSMEVEFPEEVTSSRSTLKLRRKSKNAIKIIIIIIK